MDLQDLEALNTSKETVSLLQTDKDGEVVYTLDWYKGTARFWRSVVNNNWTFVAIMRDDTLAFNVNIWQWKSSGARFECKGKVRDCSREICRFESTMKNVLDVSKLVNNLTVTKEPDWQKANKAFVSMVFFGMEIGKGEMSKRRVPFSLEGELKLH